jgi:phosphoenolpyruvate carboxylase
MDRMVELALPVYRNLVYEDDRLFKLFVRATPVRELAHVHFGSRPAYREQGTGTMRGIRAIPWIFGWTQIRLNVPSWLGVGTALSTVAAEPGGLELLRRMASSWCFFDDLLGKLEMICAKTDLEIARAYVEQLSSEDLGLLTTLEEEYHRTVDAIQKIRQSPHVLMDQPLLQTTIRHRDPYLDPLSLLQISLLRRKRRTDEADPTRFLLDRTLGTTLNGVAQGLRNTG